MQNLSGLVKSLTSVKSLFLKTVKVDETAEYALLDGGATHALRQAKASEVPHLWPVQAEMAMGSVTLYKCPWHNTLLALESVVSKSIGGDNGVISPTLIMAGWTA